MKKLFGKKVHAFLKSDGEIVSGILFDTDDQCVYLQTDVDVFAVVPKDNVKYYTSSQFDVGSEKNNNVSEEQQVGKNNSSLDVFVDNVFIINIPTPPTFDLSSFNDNIMRITLGNPDVQVALAGKIQKSIEYSPGTIYITTDGGFNIEVEPKAPTNNPPNQDSFGMSMSGSPMSNYLNPSQMVGRLNKVSRKRPQEIKNEE